MEPLVILAPVSLAIAVINDHWQNGYLDSTGLWWPCRTPLKASATPFWPTAPYGQGNKTSHDADGNLGTADVDRYKLETFSNAARADEYFGDADSGKNKTYGGADRSFAGHNPEWLEFEDWQQVRVVSRRHLNLCQDGYDLELDSDQDSEDSSDGGYTNRKCGIADIQDRKQRLDAMEKSDAARNTDAENVRSEALAMLAEMKNLTDKAQDEIKTLKDQARSAASAAVAPPPGLAATASSRLSYGASSSSTAAPPALPHELRTEAILSGVGRGLEENALLDRAADIMRRANVPQAWYESMATNYRNTAVFVVFKDPAQLRLASGKIRALNASYDGQRAWLDARRTKSENKPNRAVHRCAEGVRDLNLSIAKTTSPPPYDNDKIFKDMRRLQILSEEKGETIAWWDAKRAEIMWSQEAKNKYGTLQRGQDLDQISAWCSLE